VITFGGSYPGNLAAWFRLKFPHQTIASVASSAPVQADLDFYQYMDVVDASLASIMGEFCNAQISNATQQIQTMLQSPEGRKKLEGLFSICKPLNGMKDIQTFMANVMGNFQGTVQYDNEGNPITIQTVCGIMENTDPKTNPLANYIAVNNLFLNAYGQTCLDCSYANAVSYLKNTTDNGGARQWTYQTCTEFGYFQTTDSKNQPFGNLVPLRYYTDMCKDVFSFNFLPGINDTNNYYGGNQPKGATNILFVNGSLDPWHALSVTSDFSDTVHAAFINGTAHCADMFAEPPVYNAGLVAAQALINTQIATWLQAAKKI